MLSSSRVKASFRTPRVSVIDIAEGTRLFSSDSGLGSETKRTCLEQCYSSADLGFPSIFAKMHENPSGLSSHRLACENAVARQTGSRRAQRICTPFLLQLRYRGANILTWRDAGKNLAMGLPNAMNLCNFREWATKMTISFYTRLQ